ncbi:hypothetical protein ATCV1_z205L [Acanthocystis turfacea chlorella virus 1]|uniref:Uncharacterized protein z205L n=1 Tax=Chlorovirus heliozoae TaxID=322019 RepID=A7K8G5_9PHYC|nr:hypothetical protein ATCV1_z205L [Acanthocystis turfacea chlorella virus 1]ABT16339.1 hypothetical protein ATCV1_z205L [Acanthocystis turfacea chlorella virus 1]
MLEGMRVVPVEGPGVGTFPGAGLVSWDCSGSGVGTGSPLMRAFPRAVLNWTRLFGPRPLYLSPTAFSSFSASASIRFT